MGNITGAMVFQSAIPTSVALVFASSSWAVGPGSTSPFASAGIAFVSSAVIFIPLARGGRLTGRAAARRRRLLPRLSRRSSLADLGGVDLASVGRAAHRGSPRAAAAILGRHRRYTRADLAPFATRPRADPDRSGSPC